VNVVFHTLTSIGIGHVAARGVNAEGAAAFVRRDMKVLLPAFVAGVLSHGVLDGLKHGYPVPYVIDPPLALLVIAIWCACVKHRYRILFAVAFLGAILPDVIDLGPDIARRFFGVHLSLFGGHIFPWHWRDGSGSLYPAGLYPPRACQAYLDQGRNQAVSITNHTIVLFFALSAILSYRRPFRGRVSPQIPSASSGGRAEKPSSTSCAPS